MSNNAPPSGNNTVLPNSAHSDTAGSHQAPGYILPPGTRQEGNSPNWTEKGGFWLAFAAFLASLLVSCVTLIYASQANEKAELAIAEAQKSNELAETANQVAAESKELAYNANIISAEANSLAKDANKDSRAQLEANFIITWYVAESIDLSSEADKEYLQRLNVTLATKPLQTGFLLRHAKSPADPELRYLFVLAVV
jgi:hypothetical protein